jgi:hypothetical protein
MLHLNLAYFVVHLFTFARCNKRPLHLQRGSCFKALFVVNSPVGCSVLVQASKNADVWSSLVRNLSLITNFGVR